MDFNKIFVTLHDVCRGISTQSWPLMHCLHTALLHGNQINLAYSPNHFKRSHFFKIPATSKFSPWRCKQEWNRNLCLGHRQHNCYVSKSDRQFSTLSFPLRGHLYYCSLLVQATCKPNFSDFTQAVSPYSPGDIFFSCVRWAEVLPLVASGSIFFI